MENGEKFRGSLEKEEKEEERRGLFTSTPSKVVNKTNSVNNLFTKPKFTHSLQRVRKDQLEKLNEIAEKYHRRSFAEVLDLLLYCYDFLEEIADRYNLSGVAAAKEFLVKRLPVNQVELITSKVIELLEDIGIDGEDYSVLEQELISILISVKLKKKPAKEILKPLLVLSGRI